MMRLFPAIEHTFTMRPPCVSSGSIASQTFAVPTKLTSKVWRASLGPKVLPLYAIPVTGTDPISEPLQQALEVRVVSSNSLESSPLT